MQKSKICLPDVNVLLAFAVDGHVHHALAVRWVSGLERNSALLCRVTQMGLLRLLTNQKVMGPDILNQQAAWSVYETLLRDNRFRFVDEPPGLQSTWKDQTQLRHPAVNLWTDAYLMAFAMLSGAQMTTFDKAAANRGAVLIQ